MITKLNDNEINLAAVLESQLDKQSIDQLVTYIKNKVGGNNEIALIRPGQSSAIGAHIFVP
ncbi:hypothetical protein [Pedobacter yulinensis]|uniref:hypothetical protein n=1 Tax=Pedobacter yulinensis TaxID=2126353 RepID=UPI0013A5F840|nr:hypothetical protein [Pedobacter yulinensis]